MDHAGHPPTDPVGTWDPRAAADARAGLVVVERAMGGRRGCWQRDQVGDVIALDPALDPVERRAVLAHELVHAERGIGWGWATSATMAKEEHLVRCETADRLVPPALLARWVRESHHDGIGAAEVAEHFGVPFDVASLALCRCLR